MSTQPPEWMKPGSAGIQSLDESDFAGAPPKPSLDELLALNRRLNPIDITAEMADSLAQKALETIDWKLRSRPYPVQAVAIDMSSNRPGFGYFLEQGLGKTQTTLADFWVHFERGLVGTLIVVTVNSMKMTWAREAEEQGLPFDVHVWPNIKKFNDARPRGQVIVVNYDAIRTKAFQWFLEWVPRFKVYIAFDESTALMNEGSQQSKKGVQLGLMCNMSRVLAGLPNPMGAHNLWPQLKVIRINVGLYTAFKNRYCVKGGHLQQQIVGTKRPEELADKMKGAVFFADKRIWAAGLPEKVYARRYTDDMEPAQLRAYKTMTRELYAEIEGTSDVVVIKRTLHKSMKLQQIAAGYIIGEDGAIHRLISKESVKIKALREILADIPGKVVVFAHYKESCRQLRESFPGAAFGLSKQEMTSDELEAQKHRFNHNPGCRLFIAPLSVMQFGHTLVGTPQDPCTSVVFYENTHSLLYRRQAEDRVHRWGASGDFITYYDLIASSVDEGIVRRLKDRQELAEGLLTILKGFVYGD